MTFYSYAEQRRHYREMAWDYGCTCPMLQPHVHLLNCPLYLTPQEYRELMDEEHQDDV